MNPSDLAAALELMAQALRLMPSGAATAQPAPAQSTRTLGEWLDMHEKLLRDRGYTERDAVTRVFDGTGHNERDWAARLAQPLQFLLGGPPPVRR